MSDHPLPEMLAAFAEGDDSAASAHVASCAECSAQVAAYRKLASLLGAYAPASRNLCPPRELLLDRAQLRGVAHHDVEAHLTACPLCREDLADLEALTAAPRVALAVSWARGVVELVENALGDLLSPATPALARGGASAESLAVRRDLGDGELLEVALAPGREGVDVRVQLRGVARFRVELARRGVVLEGREAESGSVLLDGVAPGDYELSIHRAGQPPVEVALGVRAG